MATYKAARIGLEYTIAVNTGGQGSPVVAGNWTTKHRIWVKPTVKPTAGQSADTIALVCKDGTTRSLADFASEYAINVIAHRYRMVAGGNQGLATIGDVTVNYFEQNSDAAEYITTTPVTGVVVGGVTGTNQHAGQLIVTFRSGGGSIIRLTYQHGSSVPGMTVRFPTGNAGIQNMAIEVLKNSGCVRAIDGTPPLVALAFNAGTNEKLWKDYYRP